MPDQQTQTTKPIPVGPEEPRMEWRLLLAFLLTGLVMFLAPYVYHKIYGPPPKGAPASKAAERPAEAAKAAPELKPEPGPMRPVAAEKPEEFTLETDLHRITFSNRGAVVLKWELKHYKDAAGKPLELVNTAAAERTGHPFALRFQEPHPPADPNQALFLARRSEDGLGVEFEFSDGRFRVRKAFRFEKASYLWRFSSEATDAKGGLPHWVMWRGGFGDPAVANPVAHQRALYYDAVSGKLITLEAKAAKNGPVVSTGTFTFAGIQDTYFAAVFLPRPGVNIQLQTVSDTVRSELDPAEAPQVGIGVGGAPRNEFAVFVGPKDLDILRRVDRRLEQLVDFGTWFGFIAKPLFLMLKWVHQNIVPNYGWAIVLLTVFINFALLPLKFSSLKSMKKMQALQPQIAAINEKYKGISLRDPRKQQQNQELMELYRKHGVNPMGGCLPLLLQIPFFIGFYNVLTVAIELRGATWLWVKDLSQPEHLPIRILPVAMVVSQFLMQKMTPSTAMDPRQQRIMLLMPLVFGFMFYHFSSGLVLYWLTSNVVGIAQQVLFNRLSPAAPVAPGAPAKAAADASRRRRKAAR
ncbi:MAG: membrane protein insertase YidC [Bryobacterales bacterium]|nr:membrane protein insertase YidC [Bryobacteraceae bacterium]MDW8130238.1 membrane protein insertase YidC [Bryobacterales bacterium]